MLYLLHIGDIDDDEEILDWLTDPSNMELTEHIEKVNRKMFAKIRQSSENVAVFFCEIIIINLDPFCALVSKRLIVYAQKYKIINTT